MKKADNELEQYSKSNNIKISGITDTNPSETAMESARKVISILKGKGVVDLTLADKDIAHRMRNKNGRNRDIIVKLVSRMKKEEIVHNRKHLKGTGVFVNEEDLTRQNFHVYMCVKK